MSPISKIKEFTFGTAQYHVSDGKGAILLLSVDYGNNTYTLKDNGTVQDGEFKRQVERVAADLLKRKHGINFADQLRLK